MKYPITLVVIFLTACIHEAQRKADSKDATLDSSVKGKTVSVPSSDRDNSWIAFRPKYSFDSMAVKLYKGKLAGPDFGSVDYGKDVAFQEFMQERLQGLPVNFGGRYTIVEKSCGAMCSAIYMVDRVTGKIFSFPDADGHWGYKFYPNSTLLLANASLLDDSLTRFSDHWGILPEYYQWKGDAFRLLP